MSLDYAPSRDYCKSSHPVRGREPVSQRLTRTVMRARHLSNPSSVRRRAPPCHGGTFFRNGLGERIGKSIVEKRRDFDELLAIY